jgi:hypothetical protein
MILIQWLTLRTVASVVSVVPIPTFEGSRLHKIRNVRRRSTPPAHARRLLYGKDTSSEEQGKIEGKIRAFRL